MPLKAGAPLDIFQTNMVSDPTELMLAHLHPGTRQRPKHRIAQCRITN
jgi:hypothetical protein